MANRGEFSLKIIPYAPKQGRLREGAFSVVVHGHDDVRDEVVLFVVSVFVFVERVEEGDVVELSDVFGEFVDRKKEGIVGITLHQEIEKRLFDQVVSKRIIILFSDSFFIRDYLCCMQVFWEVFFVKKKIGSDILFVFVKQREKADITPFVREIG